MAKLKDYNGHYCESEYENAFLGFLEKAGWTYTAGNALPRASRHEVLLEADFKEFLKENAPDLTAGEIDQLYDTVHLAGGESDFATLHQAVWLDGVRHPVRAPERSGTDGAPHQF